jgi:VanZ family protein
MAAGDNDPQSTRERRVARWLALCALLVALGSLYPWHFAWPASFAEAWDHMVHRPAWWTGPRDVVVNIVMFVPLGLLGWVMQPSASPTLRRVALVLGAGVAFAFTLQLAQIFVPRRDAAWSDVAWNTLGLVAGLLVATTKPQR